MRIRATVGACVIVLIFGLCVGLLVARLTTWNLFEISAHQLDVIRTFFGIIAGIGGLLTGVNTVFSVLARRWAKRAADQTATTHWVNGEQRIVPVTEYARHASMAGEAARQETADLSEWVRGSGKRRLPTSDIPRIEGHYE